MSSPGQDSNAINVHSLAAGQVIVAIPPTLAGRILTAWYFFHFLVLTPVLGLIEKPRPLPESLTAAVLAKSAAH